MQRYGGLLVSDLPKPLVRGSLIPLSAMLLLFLFADLFGMYLFQDTEWSSYVFIGVFQAQAGIFCILGGTVGRSWISSFLLSAALAVVSVALFFGGSFWTNDEVPLTEAAILAIGVVPPLLFCGCVPLLFLRSFNGWHLSRSTVALTEPYSLRIEDFFMAMILVAGLLAIAPSAFGFATANGGEEDLSILLFSSVISAVASTVAVFPVSIIYFRTSTRRGRIAVLFFFAMLGLTASIACQVGYQLWNGASFPFATLDSLAFLSYAATSTVLFSLGLKVLHWSGFRIQAIAKVSKSIEANDLSEHSPFHATFSSYRQKNRVAAAGIVLASIAITSSISYLKQERLRLAETFKSLNASFLLHGGYVEHQGYKPVAMRVPPTTDNSILDLSQFKDLSAISLAGTQLTESNLIAISKMNRLMDIDVSQTAFSDSSLKHFSRRLYIEKLSLAGTQITTDGINEVMTGRRRIAALDIGDLDLDDEAFMQLHIQNVTGLILRGNPITDKSLKSLTSLFYLDLSGTKCDGSELGLLTQVGTLVLDGTLVDDSAITQLLASNSTLTRLSLRNTQVTDATLKTLAQYNLLTELKLGDGEITAQGLEAAGIAPSGLLALNSRKFTGNVFASWKPIIRRLDMSHSGVSDLDVHHLASVSGLQELSLVDCDVSDSSLAQLANMDLLKIDLTGTKVTAAMVAKIFPTSTLVHISPSQCGPEELAQHDQQGSLRIGLRYDAKNF